MNYIKIRSAKVEDASGIAKVHVETWQHAYKGLVPNSYIDNLSIAKRTAEWEEHLKDLKKGIFPLVAEMDGEIIGWCTVGYSRDEDATKETGELHGIYVHPDHMGKGVGSLLMEKGLKRLVDAGYKKATLWVLDTNEKTKRWYESNGWKLDGAEKTEEREGYDLQEIRYTIDL